MENCRNKKLYFNGLSVLSIVNGGTYAHEFKAPKLNITLSMQDFSHILHVFLLGVVHTLTGT